MSKIAPWMGQFAIVFIPDFSKKSAVKGLGDLLYQDVGCSGTRLAWQL
jgi:hypothetical protein